MHTTKRVLLAFGAAGIVGSSLTAGRLGHMIWLLTAIVRASPLLVRVWRDRGTVTAPWRLVVLGFAVLLPGLDVCAAEAVARRFLDLLDVPVPVDGHQLLVRASVGVADGDPKAPEALLQRADARMYATKRETQMSSSS